MSEQACLFCQPQHHGATHPRSKLGDRVTQGGELPQDRSRLGTSGLACRVALFGAMVLCKGTRHGSCLGRVQV